MVTQKTPSKLNLYPKKELMQKIIEGAKREKRSLNNYSLMILEHYCLENPELLGLEQLETKENA